MSVFLPIIESPTGQIKGCQENECQDAILKRFSLLRSLDQRTADDKSKSISDNSNSEQFVDKIDFKEQELKEFAVTKIINTGLIIRENEDNDVNQTESTVQNNQSIQERLGHLLNMKINNLIFFSFPPNFCLPS